MWREGDQLAHDGRAAQCGIDVRADVLVTHVFMEFRLTHQRRRLLRRTAENQRPRGAMQLVREIFERP